MGGGKVHQEPIVLVVDFHHARGPEVEFWFCDDGVDPVQKNDWALLPFMALSDGAHASTEDFSYFTLQCKATEDTPATSLFGISCTTQLDSDKLINRPADVTRSTVQKAVVAIINEPRHLGQLREKLSIVTSAWFAQRDFTDTDILQQWGKAVRLVNICHLVLAYMGLPLQIFGKGSMFGPYTPLQQLDLLADYGTKSYLVGSTNSLLLQQKDRYSDILINLDEDTVNISSPSLRAALSLSAADRRWIDFLTQTINETWDDAHPARPKTHGYLGSEEFIRLQFEEYLLALISCVKYHDEITVGGVTKQPANDIDGDPALDFNLDFLEHWRQTPNFALFDRLTSDALLFSVVEPRHPCAGGLGIEDIQRRLAQQVADLHLDERVREGRETLNKHLATGHQKVTTAFNSLWAELEARREAQRKKIEERARQSALADADPNDKSEPGPSSPTPSSPRHSTSSNPSGSTSWSSLAARKPPAVDLSQAQSTVSAASQRASAYFSSWGSWASDRRKEWQTKNTGSPVSSPTTTTPRVSMSANDRSLNEHASNPPVTKSANTATEKPKEDVDLPPQPENGEVEKTTHSLQHEPDQPMEKDTTATLAENDPPPSNEASTVPLHAHK
ncbi:uncharacterized protein GIQ15_05308 [Arthroderma uncinatum]|uniref:uncharacterized protein n=1 Tax=Arthroderma uncinatum TaxID=74035 RepID=UPI00144AD731|nr:uncharacterized protein GIQ15_05308 [Arthroderma uncinatum]KAF3482549.1 hypothetical protein GIQ15_05308 [Arthroderma uncinatum]